MFLCLICIGEPLIAGIYDCDKKLVCEIRIYGKSSDALSFLFFNIFLDSKDLRDDWQDCQDFNVRLDMYKNLAYFRAIPLKGIYYVRGVGSLSSIKLAHIFLQSIKILKNLPLYATNIFKLLQIDELKAFGMLSFFKQNLPSKQSLDENLFELTSNIALKSSLNPTLLEDISLPNMLDCSIFNEPLEPVYITQSVFKKV